MTPVYQQIQYFVNEEDLDFEICVAIVSPSANMLTVASTVEVTFEPGGSASMSVMNYLLHRKYITALSLSLSLRSRTNPYGKGGLPSVSTGLATPRHTVVQ